MRLRGLVRLEGFTPWCWGNNMRSMLKQDPPFLDPSWAVCDSPAVTNTQGHIPVLPSAPVALLSTSSKAIQAGMVSALC